MSRLIAGAQTEVVSASPFPVFNSLPDLASNNISVKNNTNSDIWVAISANTVGISENFLRIPAGTLNSWARTTAEVIYVTGPDPGQPVAAYYGELGKTLVVDKQM